MPFTPSKIAAVIFDMDGVLLDTEKLYKRAAFISAEAMGYEMTEEIHVKTVGVPGDMASLIVQQGLGAGFDYADFDRRWRLWMHDELSRHVPLKPGVVELVKALKTGGTPFAIATSTQRDAAERHLRDAGIREHFEVLVTRDDVTNGKPHPEPFLTAAAKLGVDPANCLAVEDSHNGIRAAHAAGMQVIMVPDLLDPTDEITALTIAVMTHLDEIRKVFETIPAAQRA